MDDTQKDALIQLLRERSRRLALAVDVYEYVLDSTETLEGEDKVGPDLAYLLGAIAKGTECEWSSDRPIVRLLLRWDRREELAPYVSITGRLSDIRDAYDEADANVARG